MQALRPKRHFWSVSPARDVLTTAVNGLLVTVRKIDPSGYSESDFQVVTKALSDAIDHIQTFLLTWSLTGDFQFLFNALNELQDARKWVTGGLAPSPSLRPSLEAQQALVRESQASLLMDSLSS